jgi:hypothetical protein
MTTPKDSVPVDGIGENRERAPLRSALAASTPSDALRTGWTVGPPNFPHQREVRDERFQLVARINEGHFEADKNARQIGELPDLLEALRPFAAMAQSYDDMTDTPEEIEFTILTKPEGNRASVIVTRRDFLRARAVLEGAQ